MGSEGDGERRSRGSDCKIALGIFALTGVGFWLLLAHRFSLSLDEGIYLAGAERILRGQVPYRDFFVLTGPGSFWIQAALLGVLGPTLAHARLALVADLALLSSTVYWLTERLTRRSCALIVTLFFVAFETRPLFRMYVNHRWDSNALALLAVALVFSGVERPRVGAFIAAGILAAAASWVTPPLLVLAAALGLWILTDKELRTRFSPYLLGATFCSLVATAILSYSGALLPMVKSLLWTARQYSPANRVTYGYGATGPEGLRALFTGAHGAGILARATGMISVLLPVWLPAVVLVAWILYLRRHTPRGRTHDLIVLLIAASVALIASTYPRWSADQLLFVAPIFYVLAGCFADQLIRAKPWRILSTCLLVALSVSALTFSVLNTAAEPAAQTRIGRVSAARSNLQFIHFVTTTIPAGDTLFVYPYLPIVYFVTGARNPTRYAFLQPGMMTSQDYAAALVELRVRPPQWVFYFPLTLETYRTIWPGASYPPVDPAPLDEFIRDTYHVVNTLKRPNATFYILKHNKGN